MVVEILKLWDKYSRTLISVLVLKFLEDIGLKSSAWERLGCECRYADGSIVRNVIFTLILNEW